MGREGGRAGGEMARGGQVSLLSSREEDLRSSKALLAQHDERRASRSRGRGALFICPLGARCAAGGGAGQTPAASKRASGQASKDKKAPRPLGPAEWSWRLFICPTAWTCGARAGSAPLSSPARQRDRPGLGRAARGTRTITTATTTTPTQGAMATRPWRLFICPAARTSEATRLRLSAPAPSRAYFCYPSLDQVAHADRARTSRAAPQHLVPVKQGPTHPGRGAGKVPLPRPDPARPHLAPHALEERASFWS